MLILKILAAAVLPMLVTIVLVDFVGRLCELRDKLKFKRAQKLGNRKG